MVVTVAMLAGDDELVGKAIALRQAAPSVPGRSRSGWRRRPASAPRPLRRSPVPASVPVAAAISREAAACSSSSGTDWRAAWQNASSTALAHRRAAQPRDRAGGVDDRPQSEFFVNAHGEPPHCETIARDIRSITASSSSIPKPGPLGTLTWPSTSGGRLRTSFAAAARGASSIRPARRRRPPSNAAKRPGSRRC